MHLAVAEREHALDGRQLDLRHRGQDLSSVGVTRAPALTPSFSRDTATRSPALRPSRISVYSQLAMPVLTLRSSSTPSSGRYTSTLPPSSNAAVGTRKALSWTSSTISTFA